MDRHIVVADLGYGDAGKGGIVDWLCSPLGGGAEPVHTVVRYNGGAQAAHNVVTPDGRWHTFAQFGSGTFTPGVRTFLSRFMMVDPLAMVAEAQHLAGNAEHLAAEGVAGPFALVDVDRDALLTTPYHQAANQARERARGAGRHGSCGMGIGETAAYALSYPADAPRAGDCLAGRDLERKLMLLRDWAVAEAGAGTVAGTTAGAGAGTAAGTTAEAGAGTAAPAATDGTALPPPSVVADAFRMWARQVTLTGDGHLARLLRRPGRAVFEGAQGVLLDEWRGFHPYTTWSTTTFENAEALLREAGMDGAAIRLGVTRTYQVRHGPGPFVSEDPTLELPEAHNRTGRWQGPVRAGHLDAVALRYAIEACGGVDAIALTHLDTARAHAGELRACRAYQIGARGLTGRLAIGPPRDLAYQERLTGMLRSARPVYSAPVPWRDWPDLVAEIAGTPVAIRSSGPDRASTAGGFRTLPATASL
jgi:adenylosuccinate synthase